MKSRFQPPAYFVVFLVFSIGLHCVLPITRVVPSPYRYLGVILIGFGIFINLWTDYLLKKGRTTVKPYEDPTHFEIHGPFRISRHPMYLGMFTILLGTAIILGSLITFVFPFLFFILVEVMFIRFEEANLKHIFGKEYLNYKKQVRRWI
jgi:protein-S-isoprenylcysteine O-methyltransferase Ste14